jgi:hypothetical protein
MTNQTDYTVPVVVTNLPAERRPKEYRVSHRTQVLTATNPTAQLAGANDPARCEVYLNVLDNPVVLCESNGQASDPANTTGTLTNPNGRLLAVSNGSEYCIRGADELWIATNTFPTRVGFTVVREVS